MTTYSKNVWDQLRGLAVEKLIAALKRDGWVEENNRGARRVFRHPDRPSGNNRVVIHYHNNKSKGAKILKGILDTIGWSEDDLRRLKLIK